MKDIREARRVVIKIGTSTLTPVSYTHLRYPHGSFAEMEAWLLG